MTPDLICYSLPGFAAILAAVVDAVIGGCGMVQLPTLFAIYSAAVLAALLGTNKLSAVVGTVWAALQYTNAVKAPCRVIAASAIAGFLFAVLGAWAITLLPTGPPRKALTFVLFALLVSTLRN